MLFAPSIVQDLLVFFFWNIKVRSVECSRLMDAPLMSGDCEDLFMVNIPEGVQEIPIQAFIFCARLGQVNLSDVTKIGPAAFRSCRSLTSLTIPDSVRMIGEEAFCGCNSLTAAL